MQGTVLIILLILPNWYVLDNLNRSECIWVPVSKPSASFESFNHLHLCLQEIAAISGHLFAPSFVWGAHESFVTQVYEAPRNI